MSSPPLVWDAPLGVNVWGPPSPLGSRVLAPIIPQIGDRCLGVASLPWGGSSSSGFYELGRCMVGIGAFHGVLAWFSAGALAGVLTDIRVGLVVGPWLGPWLG